MAKQDDYVRYTIRLPAPLYEKVREAAGEKSVNAEIIARLEASFGIIGLGEPNKYDLDFDVVSVRASLNEIMARLEHALKDKPASPKKDRRR